MAPKTPKDAAIGGQRDGTCQAIAYLGRRKSQAATAETVAAAVDTLKRTLDHHIDRLVQERVDGIPSEAEFREALLALEAVVPAKTMELLIRHSRLPGAVAAIDDLARRSGRDEATVAADYARLGRKLGALLGFAPQQDGLERALAPVLTFTIIETPSERAGVILRLRPGVLAALGGMVQEDPTVQP